jgi:CBS domain-containing protein
MTVKEIMSTDVEIIGRNENLRTVEDIMRNKKIRHLLVLEEGQIAGVLTQRDLFKAAMSSTMGTGEKAQRAFLHSVLVKEVMTYPVITIAPAATVQEAANLMIEKGIGCLPVVEGTQLVGIITKTDLLRYLRDQE